MSTPPYRPATIGACRSAALERRGDGTMVLRSRVALDPFPDTLVECLEHWARAAPDRTFVAKRATGADWTQVSYAQMRDRARAVGSALIARGLSVERPIAILS